MTNKGQRVRWVLHVDMDQFLVAVELLRRPELVGLPVVVGGRGDPTERAVVSTASYEARAFGVRSGVALKLAKKRCPEAVFLPVDFPHYEKASAQVMAALRAMPSAVVEVLGWDEAFVGFEVDDSVDPMTLATAARAAVFEASGLSCSVGVGDTLVRAKTATGFGKPAGVFRLTHENWLEVMGERDTQSLWGVGPRIAARLADLGIGTVAQLAVATVESLVTEFGKVGGQHVSSLGRGEGRSWPDDSPWVARAHGRETTYQRDLETRDEVADALLELSQRVVEDVAADTAGVPDGEPAGRKVARVFLKVRFKPFFTYQRSRKLPAPTSDPAVVAATALALYDALEDPRAVRLLGVRGEMTDP
ncbi:MAG TPA: DNA polymerase IV [Phycicoccus sp.]|nr:DNA polymerase IV [Phycicoccus sp.]HQK31916.1 DNA polymerase IV [Phycicoccus sp.]HQY97752.1 DNA polymerase IV [Phycicoccus sp.]HRA45725.1 DNA polymerase IV [Phycicoccus sp.]